MSAGKNPARLLLERMNMANVHIKTCPKCGSDRIHSLTKYSKGKKKYFHTLFCKNCGFKTSENISLEKAREEWNETQAVAQWWQLGIRKNIWVSFLPACLKREGGIN